MFSSFRPFAETVEGRRRSTECLGFSVENDVCAEFHTVSESARWKSELHRRSLENHCWPWNNSADPGVIISVKFEPEASGEEF